MLYDKDFLKQLDEHRSKTIYARIIALTLDETPIETIEGRVTQGSVNVDGDSAVRRTCSLTLIAQDFDYNEFIWGLNTKFKLEIGVENTIDPVYPDIIWFKQGTYFISSFNTSHSTNNFSINVQGKDKMCALNGELGGALTSSVDFGTAEEVVTLDNKTKITKITKLTLKEIIRNAVHLYGGEPLHNIIINDLDISGLELLEYRYDVPLYLYRIQTIWNFVDNVWIETIGDNPDSFINVTLNGETRCKVLKYNKNKDEANQYPWDEDGDLITFNDLQPEHLQLLVTPLSGTEDPARLRVYNSDTEYIDVYVAKVSYGETAGYRYTDLTYPGDLIGAVGESITSILDKIKAMLGEYEYFYDLDGQFIFQKKRNMINNSTYPLGSDSDGNTVIDLDKNVDYTFSGGVLITSFNNNPDLTNLKNDYSVWGTRQSVSGAQLPVHMRYAIDKKPTSYTLVDKDENGNPVTYSTINYDWREIVYQIAKDYYSHTNDDDFAPKLAAANMEHYPSGKTGYESYYQDILGFWRDLYNPEVSETEYDSLFTNTEKTDEEQITTIQNDINSIMTLLKSNPDNTAKKQELQTKQELLARMKKYLIYYYQGEHQFWNKTVFEAPHTLNFWFDFLDSEGELSQFSVKNVGCRPKAVNDSNVKAIYFRETPNIIFTDNFEKDRNNSSAYTYISISSALMKTMFSISAQGKSAKAMTDELLYKHGYCTESATISSVPIYYLEPNARIHLIDEKSKIDGYYNVSKFSIPLTYNGTMSITATKAVESI